MITSYVKGSKINKANKKLEKQMDKVVTLTGGLANDRIYEKNPDTNKMRSRKSGDYENNKEYEPMSNGSKYYKSKLIGLQLKQ